MPERGNWNFQTLNGPLGLVVAVIGIYFLATKTPRHGWLHRFIARTGQMGWKGVILFVAAYVICTTMFIPATVFTLGAGAIFGVAKGVLYVVLGANGSAVVSFLLGRSLLRDWVKRQRAKHPRLAALDRAVAAEGWKIIALTRLSPAFPFAFLNYTYGASQVRFGGLPGLLDGQSNGARENQGGGAPPPYLGELDPRCFPGLLARHAAAALFLSVMHRTITKTLRTAPGCMKSILIIEDNLETLEFLKLLLERAGYRTFAALGAEQGLDLFEQHSMDLVITDLFMPETNGFEVIKALQAKHPQPKIVVISGECAARSEEDDRLAATLGVLKTFSKPFDPHELIGFIEKVLAARTD